MILFYQIKCFMFITFFKQLNFLSRISEGFRAVIPNLFRLWFTKTSQKILIPAPMIEEKKNLSEGSLKDH